MGTENPVTLVVLYAPLPGSGRQAQQSALPPVRLRLLPSQVDQIIRHRQQAMATIATFTDRDANGRAFCIDVGSRAVAVYVEE